MVSKRDVGILAGAAVATGALAPFDRDIQRGFRGEDIRDSRRLHHTAGVLAFTGGPGPFVVGGTLYVLGEAAGSERLALMGVNVTEAVLMAAGLNGIVKGVAGRALPNANGVEPGEFSFGRGFHEGNGAFVSFPSGHTAASFAAAAVVAGEVSAWNPRAGRFVAPAAYSLASLVALSRLYQNLHWASDLPLGAVIGLWSGKTVLGWQQGHSGSWLVRQLEHVTVVPDSRRLTIGGQLPLALQ